MHKKVLTEQAIYYGNVNMPKHWQIDSIDLSHHILHSSLTNKKFIFSKTWDKLNSYITEYVNLNYNIQLINKESWGNIYIPSEKTEPILNVDPIDLKNSPDYTLIYSIDVEKDSSEVVIEYDDNRRAGRTWHIPLENNHFVMFPASQKYMISPNTSNKTNIILTITYEYI